MSHSKRTFVDRPVSKAKNSVSVSHSRMFHANNLIAPQRQASMRDDTTVCSLIPFLDTVHMELSTSAGEGSVGTLDELRA